MPEDRNTAVFDHIWSQCGGSLLKEREYREKIRIVQEMLPKTVTRTHLKIASVG